VSRLTGLPAVCAAAPAVAATAFCGAVLCVALFGGTPAFWQGGSLTLSEAAALRDQGVVARLIEAGADPDREYPLRPDVIATDRATPLEAAVAARRAEIVNLLMNEGATMDERSWRHLHCLAVDSGAGDVVDAIDAHRPATASAASCTQ
jgi:hypothetical protein